MTGQCCAVAWCRSNRFKFKREGKHIIFHVFPKEKNSVSKTIRKEWINFCKRKDKFNPNTSAICSLHFTPNDYERDLQNELLGLPLRQVLKKTAVPTVNISIEGEIVEDMSCDKIASEDLVLDPLESCLSNSSVSLEPPHLLDIRSTSKAAVPELFEQPTTSTTSDIYKQKYEDLLLKYNQLNNKYCQSNKKIKELNQMLKYYKTKYNQPTNKRSKSVKTKKF